jgi:hypothetical protein
MNDGLFSGVGSGAVGTRGRFSVEVIESSASVGAPSWARFVSIIGVGGGGGGGGGRLGLTTNAGGGAGGGGGGARYIYRMPLVLLRSQNVARFTVTIGAGGTSGAGATVDGNNGSSGGTAGTTTVVYRTPSIDSPYYDFGITVGGGTGGTAGGTGIAAGGGGGTSPWGNAGVSGGQGNTANSSSIPGAGAATASINIAPIVVGGYGAPGKNDSPSMDAYPGPFYFGYNIATSRLNVSTGLTGVDSRTMNDRWVRYALTNLVRAPEPTELWFTSILGGMAGSSGSSSGAAVSGGNGGAGWRGSGGGGGAGAGVSGAFGGSGGVGGSGVVYFFWEEY